MMPADPRAHAAVNAAIGRGLMPPAAEVQCLDCGRTARLYHHESYAAHRWLDVEPLCTSCHAKRHLPERLSAIEAARTKQQARALTYWRRRRAEEAATTIPVQVTVSASLLRALRAQAKRERRNVPQVMLRAVTRYIRQMKARQPKDA